VLAYCDDLHPVRSFVASRAKRAGLAPLRIPDLVLAISELAANTLRHTGGGGMPTARHTDGKHDHETALPVRHRDDLRESPVRCQNYAAGCDLRFRRADVEDLLRSGCRQRPR
jgi:hypothetical protein